MAQEHRVPPAADVASLVEAARRGEPAAFGALFRVHHARVHRVVYRLVGPSPDVDDLVQQVFVEGFRSLRAFRGEALFSTWLSRIAVRVTMRAVKRPRLPMSSLDASFDAVAADASPDQT